MISNDILPQRSHTRGGSGVQSCHYVGAASEHLAAAYYLSRGGLVFWPAVQHSRVDFVVLHSDRTERVQVKTGSWNRAAGPWAYLQVRVRPTNRYQHDEPWRDFDTLFVVHSPECWVIPARELDSSNLSLLGTCPDREPSRWDIYRHPLIGERPENPPDPAH